MRNFVITKHDDGIRLNRFLERTVPLLSQSLMYRYLRLKRIKVNGKKCEASTRLNEGDELVLYINDEFFEQPRKTPDFMKASRNAGIIYEDENIVVMYKPAGVFCHSAYQAGSDTLINRLLRHLFENGEYAPDSGVSFVPSLCNRLDYGTEGLVIAAKTSEISRSVNNAIKNGGIIKNYLCAVSCTPPKPGVYTAYLEKDERTNTAKVFEAPAKNAKKITTAFNTLASNGALSLLDVELITGRFHQIRAHLAFFGCRIIGDQKYGDPKINKKYGATRQALCSYKLKFNLEPETDAAIYYLNGKVIETGNVSFLARFFPDFNR